MNTYKVLFIALLFCYASCYKLEDLTPDYEDGLSTVIYDLPGDTLASDGWEARHEEGDTYLRQRYYNSRWTDSIRMVPWSNEKINAAAGVDANTEAGIVWLTPTGAHPAHPSENQAYTSLEDGYDYIYRSGTWYRMSIEEYKEPAGNTLINWRGYITTPPSNPEKDWVYRDNDNGRVYIYTGKAWALMTYNADYRSNTNFIEIEYSKSGKETGNYSLFLFRFRDRHQQFIRDAADSARYLRTDSWDLAFTGTFNSHIWLNNAGAETNPGFGGPLTKTAVIMYPYGYDFMQEAPPDSLFDAVSKYSAQIGFSSEYGEGVNAWYEYSNATHIAQPFPYRAFYLRLQRIDPVSGASAYRYGKLQLISMYKGAPEVVTDLYWPSPYFTFRYFIQEDGSRNLRTRN